MKRKFLVVGMGLVLVISLAGVAGAFLGFSDPGQTCINNANFGGFFLRHDTCVVCINKGNNSHTCLCKIFEEQGVLPTLGFTNFGACVNTLAQL